MLKVAHAIGAYLPQSATFIWQYLHSFKQTYPVVITNVVENLDQFPIPNGKIYAVPLSRWSPSWFKDNFYRRVFHLKCGYKENILRLENVNLIHAHFGLTGYNHLDLAAAVNVPLLTTFYGYDLSVKTVIEQRKEAYARLFTEGDIFLVEGPFMRDALISLGCPSARIHIQRLSLDLDDFSFKPPSWDGKRPIGLLIVGRFVEKKGIAYSFQALARIKKDYSFRLRMVGGGELEQDLRRLAGDLGLTEQIEWLGMQPRKRVIEELQSCDILLHPSIIAADGDSEGGAPTVILEAQACGVPVVASTHADIPYITRPNESALLSPERDVDGLARNIRYLFDRPDVWSQMGGKGREHMERYHDVKKEVKVLEDLYSEVIKGVR